MLLAARDEGVRRVVFSSSTSVYGSSRQLPTTEDTPPDPISPYGVAKLAAERYCVSFSRVYDSFETVVLRYFNVFGPRQSPLSQYAAVVPLFVTAIDAGEPVQIHGDGEQSRDFTYVGNVVDATIRAGEADGASGEIFNIAAGSPASVNQLADTIGTILGKPVVQGAPPAARRRHPRLVGRPQQGGAHPRLPARDRAGRGTAPHGRVSPWLTATRTGADQGSARDRATERRRAGSACRVPHRRARRARLRDDAGRRDARARRGVDGRPSPRRAACESRRCLRSIARSAPLRDAKAILRLARLIKPRTADDPAHAHGEGRRGRTDRRTPRRRRTAADHRPHVPRPRAAWVLQPADRHSASGRSSAGSHA